MLFAWTVCRRVRSNAIVIAKDGATLGIGAGQMSRVDSVRLAVEKCREARGEDADGLLAGSALASDAFFPFADGPELAIQAGVTAVIQPGGSKRDAEVDRRLRRRRRGDGLHQAPPLPPLDHHMADRYVFSDEAGKFDFSEGPGQAGTSSWVPSPRMTAGSATNCFSYVATLAGAEFTSTRCSTLPKTRRPYAMRSSRA